MDDLQNALQSILSDPEQMARVAALAESLGLKPPDGPPPGERPQNSPSERSEESVFSSVPPSSGPPPASSSAPPFDPAISALLGQEGPNLGRLMGLLAASGGGEARVLTALRPALPPEGQSRVDRALRAAKLSRLAGALLTQRGENRV